MRSFRGFADELDMLRTRLACLLARAEESCQRRNISEKQVRWLAATIELLGADLVQEFDRLCDAILAEFLYYCDHYVIMEKDILVPKTVKVLEPEPTPA